MTCSAVSLPALVLPAATKRGAPGTYNYLIDTLLAVPRTRQMYMRRLRTLMDSFIATGRLEVCALVRCCERHLTRCPGCCCSILDPVVRMQCSTAPPQTCTVPPLCRTAVHGDSHVQPDQGRGQARCGAVGQPR
jgi:hypothetical protein